MATASGRMIKIWDASTFGTVNVIDDVTGGIWTAAFSRDGTTLAVGRSDGDVQLLEIPSGRPVATLTGHSGEVAAVTFSPSGLLASGGADGTIRLWDFTHRSEIASMVGLGRNGWAALFPDGSYKLEGDPTGSFWWTIKGCRFEAGELDPYVPEIRRLPADAPIPHL
jgi:WD40 repeat protein